jgi:hypothetical protein
MSQKCWFADTPTTVATLPKIWQQCLGVERVAELSLEEKNVLTRACMGYILRIYKFTNVVKLLNSGTRLTVPEMRTLRHSLTSDFRTLLGLKMIIVRCLVREMQQQPRRLRRELHLTNQQINSGSDNAELLLTEADIAIYHNLSAMHLKKLLMLRLPELPENVIPTVRQVITQCGETMQKLEGWIMRFARRKLRFISTSQNLELHDIIAELHHKATCAFYLYTPWQSIVHRENTVKRVIHNHGMALIDDNTRPENNRLQWNPYTNKYENLIITDAVPIGKWTAASYNRPEHIAAVEDDTGEFHINTSIGLPSFHRLDNRLIIQRYIGQHGELAETILELLTMEDNNDFIQYVKQQTEQELDSNELIYNTLGRQRYLALIAGFLQVPKAAVKSVVSDVRELLTR